MCRLLIICPAAVAIAVVGGRKRAEAAALTGLDLAGALETHFESG